MEITLCLPHAAAPCDHAAVDMLVRCFLHSADSAADASASLSEPSRTKRTDEGYVQVTISEVAVEKGPLPRPRNCKCPGGPTPAVAALLAYLRAALGGLLVVNRLKDISDQQLLAMFGLDVDGEGRHRRWQDA